MYRFNGFTEKANRALNIAIEQAQEFGHTYIGSEHILLGILQEGSGTAAALLNDHGVTTEAVTELLTQRVGRGSRTRLSPNDFTPRAKRILEICISAARSLNSGYVGTEHILTALLSEDDSCANYILSQLSKITFALHLLDVKQKTP
jgi:ATP-dependent Clp protease ATP-binding subunit ClpC